MNKDFEYRDDLPEKYYCSRCGQQLFDNFGGICSTCECELEIRGNKYFKTTRCPDCGKQAKQHKDYPHVYVCACGLLFDKEAIEAERKR